jgi:uncharacterized protein YkwD
MKRLRLSAGLLLAGATLAAAPAIAAATVPQAPNTHWASTLVARPLLDRQILQQINVVRAERGLRPLRRARSLAAVAADHSREMAEDGFFAHESADRSGFSKRLLRYYTSTGFSRWAVGENLLWASPDVSASEAVKDWLRSPAHRHILLDPDWSELGVAAIHDSNAPGVYDGLGVTIVTADFGVRIR